MQLFYLMANIAIVFFLLLLSFLALVRNARDTTNRTFAYFTISLSVWIIANFISNDVSNSADVALISNYVVFLASYTAMVFLLRFVVLITNDKLSARRFRRALPALIAVGAIAPTPLVVAGVEKVEGVYSVEFGLLSPLYFIALLLVILWGIVVLYRSYRHGDSGHARLRSKVILISWLWTLPVALLANVVLPILTGSFGLSNLGVLPMAILVVGLYYAVSRHRLFDVRWFIARSVGYTLSLVVLVGLYSLILFGLITYVFRIHVPWYDQVIISTIIAVGTIVFQPLKIFFDRRTNALFYRDAYDARALLDALNQVFMTNLQLQPLLQKVTTLLGDRMKVTGVALRVQTEDAHFTAGATTASDVLIHELHAAATHLRLPVLVVDDLPQDLFALKNLAVSQGVLLFAPIPHLSGLKSRASGYALFGQRQTGNAYTQRDSEVMETVVKELYVGIQNALQFQQIQEFNVTLQQKVDEATARLRQTNEKLKALDATKDDFISMASHQLRTPLTSIKGYISMVLEGDAGKINDMQHKMLSQAFISSQRMTYLISDLLNVSRLKTGKFVVERTEVDLAELVQQEIAQLDETLKARNLTLEFVGPDSPALLLIDETKTRQVVMNFTDNAIYYTPGGGHITVTVTTTDKMVEFTVKDTGIGVPKTMQHRLFSKFYRAPNAKSARPDGTGLGLFMAKKAIVAQGGAIVFKSEEGKGSTFGFSFPKNVGRD